VIVTATTHLGTWQTKLADKHIATDSTSLDEVLNTIDNQGVTLITGGYDAERTKPINEEFLKQLHQHCKSSNIPLLIEADGSRQKPLKAWADHEPPIPEFVEIVVHVAGMNGLGKHLTDENVHRAEFFSKLGKIKIGDSITPKAVMEVLSHPKNGMKNAPSNAKKILLLNQADNLETQSIARSMVPDLSANYSSILIANLANGKVHAVHEKIAVVILAAGQSKRLGRPKQLLEWKGQSFVRTVTQTAIESGFSPVIVVIGSNAELVEAEIRDLDIRIIRNNNWEDGQGGSIKEAVRAIPPDCGGAIFLLVDQPQVSTSIIHALGEKHAEGLFPIVAPMIIDRRGNPVLFDRVTFPDLMSINGDIGGRAAFHKHRVEYLPWHDDSLLLDVDTPEQYQRLVSNTNL
jgi:molybdenum cofactor cytidylyltransferase